MATLGATTETFLQAFRNGKDTQVPHLEVHSRFAPFLVAKDRRGRAKLAFEEGPSRTVVLLDDNPISSLIIIQDAPEYLSFWRVIAGLLRDFPYELHWPIGMIVGSADLIRHLPVNYVKVLGEPLITTDEVAIRDDVARRRVVAPARR